MGPGAAHPADLGVRKKLFDGVIDRRLEAFGDLAIVVAEVLGPLDEIGSGVGMETEATSGRSLGHAP